MGDEYTELRARIRENEIVLHGRRFYVVEQDILLDEDELTDYIQRQISANARPDDAPPGHSFVDRERRLLARTKAGRVVRWHDGRVLGYSVGKVGLGDQYDLVVSNMSDAARAWQDICGIRFDHLQALDSGNADDGDNQAVFTVIAADMKGKAIAAAFFPDDPPDKRSIRIDPSYFSPKLRFDEIGILRHEIGHILGFRHEHIRKTAGWLDCNPEDLRNTKALTPYDSNSVMHYLCEGVGSRSLDLTNVDIEGALLVYGPPFGQFELVS